MLGKNSHSHSKKKTKPKPNAGATMGAWRFYEDDDGNLVAHNYLSDRLVLVATQFEENED